MEWLEGRFAALCLSVLWSIISCHWRSSSAYEGKFLECLKMTIFWSKKDSLWSIRAEAIQRFHMTSRRPYLCSKTIPWELNSFHMWMLCFVPITLHRCWSREWKRSIKWLMSQRIFLVLLGVHFSKYLWGYFSLSKKWPPKRKAKKNKLK